MAKGARASTKRSNRTALRARVFKPVEDARAVRLNAKLQELIAQPLPEREEMDLDTAANTKANEKPGVESTKEADTMEVDGAPFKTTKSSSSAQRSERSKSKKAGRVHKNSHRKARNTVVFPKKIKLLGASKKQK